MDLDLRKLRYFAAVAEHRHFGRAAAHLYIAQPVLSRQVRALEQELGCELLVRTTRTVELTPAGEQLAGEARDLLAAADAALRRVNEIDRGSDRLVIAFGGGLHVSPAVRAYTALHPGVTIELLSADWWEQDALLRDGRAHVEYLRRTFDETGLRVIPMGSEPMVACLSATHPLARRRTVTRADLAGEPVVDAQRRRTQSGEHKFELIAAGRGIVVLPRSVAAAYPNDDVVHRRVRDIEPVGLCLAVAKGQRQRRVLDFVDIAVETLQSSSASLSAV